MRTDPFRDEVAIDFPSTRYFIARLRDAFLRDGRRGCDDTLHAEVLVSSEEAFRGALLPLVVVLSRTCGVCGGRGEVWTESCLDCGGAGSLPTPCSLRVLLPPGVADGARLKLRVRTPDIPSVRVEIRVAIRNLRI